MRIELTAVRISGAMLGCVKQQTPTIYQIRRRCRTEVVRSAFRIRTRPQRLRSFPRAGAARPRASSAHAWTARGRNVDRNAPGFRRELEKQPEGPFKERHGSRSDG